MSLNKNFKLDPSYVSFSSVLTGCLRGFMALALISCSMGQSCDMKPVVPGLGSVDDQVLGFHPEQPEQSSTTEATDPVAQAETEVAGIEGETVLLDGSASYDPNNGELTYVWEQTSGPSVELHDANTSIASFTAPSVEAVTSLSFTLTVSAHEISSVTTVNVQIMNGPSTAEEILISASTIEGDAPFSVDLAAVASNGKPLPEGQYRWSFNDGTTGEGTNVKHVFSSGGVYSVALCITIGAASRCSEKEITSHAQKVGTPGSPDSPSSPISTPSTHTISGLIQTNGNGVPNITVVGTNGGSSITDAQGRYQITVPHDWTGTVTPMTNSYLYTPSNRTFSLVKTDVTGQDYAAATSAPVVNNIPVIVQGSSIPLSTMQNTPATLQLSATDLDASSLVWTVINPAQSGVASVISGSPSSSGGTVTINYQPGTNFTGSDAFAIRVNDGQGGTDSIAVAVTVTAAPASTPSSGKSYYVSTTGSDTNSGTQALPFKTVQKAANTALAGDTVIISGGTYNSGSTAANVPVLSIAMTKNGAAGAPITFKAAPGQTVIFDGKNGISTSLVDVRGSYIDFEGLELTGARRTAIVVLDDNNNGVVDAHHINVRLCYAHHNNHDANYIGGAFRTIGPVQYVVFEDCMSHDNSIGFEFRESPSMSAGQMSVPPIAGNIGYAAALPESQWDSWPGWVAYAGRYNVIRRCLAFNNRLIDEMSDGIGCRYAIECTFEDNISFGNGDDNYDLLGSTRCTVRRNIGFNANPLGTTDGDGNGMKVGVRGGLDNVIYNNILFNNPRAGIDVADTERAKVYNNTCVNNSWFGIWFEASRATVGGATVLNNITKGNTQGDIGRTSVSKIIRRDYNCVSDANNGGASFAEGIHGSINTNPAFANESLVMNTNFPAGLTIPQRVTFIRDQVNAKLGLATGSPCVNTAEVISGITGAILGSAPDKGAVESH